MAKACWGRPRWARRTEKTVAAPQALTTGTERDVAHGGALCNQPSWRAGGPLRQRSGNDSKRTSLAGRVFLALHDGDCARCSLHLREGALGIS